jgi:DNA modification methylase
MVANRENKLNELDGKEWLKFTKSWFVHNPPPRGRNKTLHPASFPETLVRDFILFFTKPGQWVLDPFLGTGSTLVAAKEAGRNGVGVEIYPVYATIARDRLTQVGIFEETRQLVIEGDARDLRRICRDAAVPPVDFAITSPPYWNQLKRNHIRQQKRAAEGLNTEYGADSGDLGNLDPYEDFLTATEKVFDAVFDVVKPKGYLVVITNNVFFEGRLYPLAYDTARVISRRWTMKDEKIWCQDDKKLEPFGIYNAWVGNRCHQYCLVFRKEHE